MHLLKLYHSYLPYEIITIKNSGKKAKKPLSPILQSILALYREALHKTTSNYFKRKIPANVRQNLNFELSDKTSFNLVKLAEKIFKNSQRLASNNFKANLPFIKNSKLFRPNY